MKKFKTITLIFFLIVVQIDFNIWGQEYKTIDWNNLVEFKIIKRSTGTVSFIEPSELDTISVIINLGDVKRVLKKIIARGHNRTSEVSTNYMLGQATFSNGQKRMLRIGDKGFQDLSDNNQNYSFIEWNNEWNYFKVRVPQTVKDSLVLKFEKETNETVSVITKSGKDIPVFKICEDSYEKVDFFIFNLTEKDIEYFDNSNNVALNAVGFLTKVDREDNNKEFALIELKKLINHFKKRILLKCSDSQSVSIAEYCLNLLIKKNSLISPNFKLKRKEIRELKKQIKQAEMLFLQ